MKKLRLLSLAGVLVSSLAFGQLRYNDPVFAGQIDITSNVTYGTNIDFIFSQGISDPANGAQVQADLIAIQTAIATGQPIPTTYYNPADPGSIVKVTDLKMDIYQPDQMVDTEGARPVILLLHTGNFLPPIINGSPTGSKADSSIVNLAKRFAERGYVAVTMNYRGGWLPTNSDPEVRRSSLLNAVYRAIHDAKQCVRTLKQDANTVNTYKINPNKIVLFGEGSGGYVSLAYLSMDKFSELSLPKFTWASGPNVGQSYIDTNTVGGLDGLGGILNLYQDNGVNSDVAMQVNTGGALADTSWLEQGDAPMVSFHAVRDGYAPFENGIVIVPTTNEDVVEVQGPNLFIKRANDFGNNAAFFNTQFFEDPYTDRARSVYGNAYSYYLPAPNNNVTVTPYLEGCFPVVLPLAPSQLQNGGAPWQWWDLNTLTAVVAGVNGQLGTNYDANAIHQGGLASNPNMSPTLGNAWLDTIQGYALPRVMLALNLPGAQVFSVNENPAVSAIDIYPNPVNDRLTIDLNEVTTSVSKVELMNSLGQIVRSENVSNLVIEWSIPGLDSGIYFLNFEFENGERATRKVIVQ